VGVGVCIILNIIIITNKLKQRRRRIQSKQNKNSEITAIFQDNDFTIIIILVNDDLIK
jgi:hypothetical protein